MEPHESHIQYAMARLQEAEDKTVARLKQEFFAHHRAVVQSGRTQYALTRDMSGKHKFRITCIDELGPVSHACYDRFSEAVHDLAETAPMRPDLPPEYCLSKPGEFEHVYASTLRPIGPGAVPQDGLIRTEPGGKFGHAVYSRVLTRDELDHFSLQPVASNPTQKKGDLQ